MKSLVQDAIIEYFERHKVISERYKPNKNDFELEALYDFFDEYITKHTYFN